MSSLEAFVGRSWVEWSNSTDQSRDQARDHALEVISRETPHLQIDRDIAQTQSGRGSLLGKCAICRQVVKLCALRRHVQVNHPDRVSVKTEPAPQSPVIVTSPAKAEIKQEPNINNNAKPAKAKKRPNQNGTAAEKKKRIKPEDPTLRKESRSDRSIFFNRSNPVVIYGEVGSSEESDVEEEKYKLVATDGLNYINRLVQPMAFPRYGCYSDISKGSKVLPFSSAARQLNQQLSLISQSGPVLPGMEGPEFEGSSPMTPLSQPSPKLKPVLSQVRVQH